MTETKDGGAGMSADKITLIDGVKVERMEVIRMARQVYDYQEPSGIYLTSKAAKILRDHGHSVEETAMLSEREKKG